MITLATLEQATPQEVFNQAKNHLLNQMEKSYLNDKSETCSYRSKSKLHPEKTIACAGGCFISDEDIKTYKIRLGSSWSSLIDLSHIPSAHKALISRLQLIHDRFDVKQWARELESLAYDYNLKYNS